MVSVSASDLDKALHLNGQVTNENLEVIMDLAIDALNIYGASLPNLGTTTTESETFVLGYTAIGANDHAVPANWWWGYRCIATKTATLTKLLAYCRGLMGPTNIKAKIWADNAGEPAALLAESEGIPVNTIAWYTFPLTLAVTNGTYYWLGLFSQADHLVKGDVDTANNDYFGSSGDYAYPNNPASFIITGHSANKLSIFGSSITSEESQKSVDLTSKQRGGVFVVAREIYGKFYLKVGTGTVTSGFSVTVGDVLDDNELASLCEKIAEKLAATSEGVAFCVAEDTSGIE